MLANWNRVDGIGYWKHRNSFASIDVPRKRELPRSPANILRESSNVGKLGVG